MEAFAPPKSDSFAWSVVLGRLCTEHFLAQKGFIRDAENLDFHILRWRCRNCKSFAAALPKCLVSVDKIIDWWSVYWAIPGSVDELFLNWSYFSHGDMQKRCGVWFYIQHYIWSIGKSAMTTFSIMLNHNGMDVFLWSFTELLYGFHTNIDDHFVYMAIDLERNS